MEMHYIWPNEIQYLAKRRLVPRIEGVPVPQFCLLRGNTENGAPPISVAPQIA